MVSLKDSLVAYWKLNENAASVAVVDSGPLGHTGVASINTDGLSVTGKINNAFEFDKDAGVKEYVTLTDTGSDLQFEAGDQDFTICQWLKVPDNVGTLFLFSYEDADNDGWNFILVNGKPRLSIDAQDVFADDTIGDNAWHFVAAVVHRAGNGKIYIDAAHSLGASSAIDGEVMAITMTSPKIGMRSYQASSYFGGVIDELVIFNKALTQEEITFLYNGGFGTGHFDFPQAQITEDWSF